MTDEHNAAAPVTISEDVVEFSGSIDSSSPK